MGGEAVTWALQVSWVFPWTSRGMAAPEPDSTSCREVPDSSQGKAEIVPARQPRPEMADNYRCRTGCDLACLG